jgi:hypothetical protein
LCADTGDKKRGVPPCAVFFVASKRQELCETHAKERLKNRMDAVAKRRREERAEERTKIRKRRKRGRSGRVVGKVSRAKARARRRAR